jgi:hypothetical protein
MGSEFSPVAGWSASVLFSVKDDCPALVTVNVKVAIVPLPLKGSAGFTEYAKR